MVLPVVRFDETQKNGSQRSSMHTPVTRRETGIDLGAAGQGVQRQRVVVDRIAGGEERLDLRLDLRDVPAHGEARRDDRAHAGPADEIRRAGDLVEGLQHPEMGQPARSAPAEDEAPCGAAGEPGEAMQIAPIAVSKLDSHRGRQGGDLRMQGLRAPGRRILTDDDIHPDPIGADPVEIGCRAGPRRRAGLGQEQDVVAAPLALPAPGAVDVVRCEDRARMAALEGLEPGLVGPLRPVGETAGCAGQQGVEGAGELPRNMGRIGPLRHGQDREDSRRMVDRMAVVDRPQAVGEHPGEVEERVRMLGDDRLEGIPGEPQEMRIAQGHHGGRPRSVRQQGHLAEGFGRAQARDPGRPTGVVAGGDADHAGDERVEGVSGLALLEQDPATRNRNRHHAGPNGRDRRRVEPGQERDLGGAHPATAAAIVWRSPGDTLSPIVPSPSPSGARRATIEQASRRYAP